LWYEKKPRFELIQLFLAKAGLGLNGFDKCFYGTMREFKDEYGNQKFFSRVIVKYDKHNGVIFATGSNRIELQLHSDSLVVMILYKGLHEKEGNYFETNDFKYFMD